MGGVVLALGALFALVYTGMKRSLDPAKNEASERSKLRGLKAKKRLTLDDAEDGLVLARRYQDAAAVKWFGTAVAELKKRRVKI